MAAKSSGEKTVSFLHSESFSVLERTKQCTKHRYSKKIFYPSHKQHSKDLKCWGTWNSESEFQESTVVYGGDVRRKYVQYNTFFIFLRLLLLSCQSFTVASVAWRQCITLR
jgi:hypothetical protein